MRVICPFCKRHGEFKYVADTASPSELAPFTGTGDDDPDETFFYICTGCAQVSLVTAMLTDIASLKKPTTPQELTLIAKHEGDFIEIIRNFPKLSPEVDVLDGPVNIDAPKGN